jgi:hypothetical protein
MTETSGRDCGMYIDSCYGTLLSQDRRRYSAITRIATIRIATMVELVEALSGRIGSTIEA